MTGGASYFDPERGYVTPSDDYEADTSASLKEIIKALARGDTSDDLYDAVERLIYKYQIFVLQGIREDIAKHKGVSWYLVDKLDEQRALISYQDGPHGEWCYECYADEVPLWLLTSLFRRIARRKPLGDQDADDTIAHVDRLDTEYESVKDKRATERGGLDVITYPSYLRKRGCYGD